MLRDVQIIQYLCRLEYKDNQTMQRIILAITAMVMTLTAAAYTVTHCQAGQP